MSNTERTGAAFARGNSKQDYRTPVDFLEAVRLNFGSIDFDLAAHHGNHITPKWFGPGGIREDTLALDPTKIFADPSLVFEAYHETFFLNPPYDDIRPWAEWCSRAILRPRQRVLLLVPASVGSNWYADYVHNRSGVRLLRPRLSFDGKNPFPKDCLLAAYGEMPSVTCWKWK